MTSKRKQAAVAAAVTFANIAVAIAVNVLTSGWSWLVFVVLAVLSAAWVALEVWRAVPRPSRGERLGAPALPGSGGSFVPRPELTGRIVRSLLAGRSGKVGITTALAGAGGFGKTTLALEVCTLPAIAAAFGTPLWVTVGQEIHGAALAKLINDLIERVEGQRPGITSPEQAGIRLGEVLRARGRSLLVVDDVWTAEQLRPFLSAGQGCTLLVTTRIPDLLPADAEAVPVDQMSRQQAKDLVGGGLPALPETLGEQLLDITGRWPLALSLANAALRRAERDGADVADAAERLLRRLRDLGPTALDVADAARRDRAVAATLESSLGLLGERRIRAVELAIFPEDTEIPVDLVVLLWRTTAGLTPDESDRLCHELAELSLIIWRGDRAKFRLHDVIRTYLRHECGQARRRELNQKLLDAVATTLTTTPDQQPVEWWKLPSSADYLWRTLGYHLAGADRTGELSKLVTHPLWVTGKLRRFGPVAVAEDLAPVGTATAKELSRFLDQLAHLLTPTTPDHAVVNALALRLPRSPALEELRDAAVAELEGLPRLVAEMDLPDLPDPALNRVLAGHDGWVRQCTFTPAGDLMSAAYDGIRVWNTETGRLIRLLTTPSSDYDFALSADGRSLALPGEDNTIEIRDVGTWQVRAVLTGLRDSAATLCFSADSRTIVCTDDKTIRLWDAGSGKQLRSFKMPDTVEVCVPLRDGTVVTLDGSQLRIWNLGSGTFRLLLDTGISPDTVVVSPDQRWLAAPGSRGLAVFDLTAADRPALSLHQHEGLTTAAFSPDGRTLATGSSSGNVVFWDVAGWRPTGQISAHGSDVEHLAFTPNGSVLASAGNDGTVRLWHAGQAHSEIARASAPTGSTRSCAAATDGSWLAVARSDSVTIHDPVSRAEIENLAYPERTYEVIGAGNHSLLVEQHSSVLVCDAGNWQASRTLQHPADSVIHGVSIGGHLVCMTDGEDRVLVWDTGSWEGPLFATVDDSGVHRAEPPAPDADSVTTKIRQRFNRTSKKKSDVYAQLGPDGEWLAIGTGTTIHIVVPKTWKVLKTIPLNDRISGLIAVPNGRRLAVRVGKTVQHVDTATWTVSGAYTDHDFIADATDLSWSPEGSLLATVSDDQTLRIIDAIGWRCLTELRLDGELTGCAWLAGDRLAVVGGHGIFWFTFVAGVDRTGPDPMAAAADTSGAAG
ncbi:NB-ARC domain-containing protein [Amycolatopsis sp. RTGN1]|uniref:NB-ARC domain-containing protein n=1 Tax=Amycolatopsis ponsaeliensis TaxID=2992142 RepID=UPI0025514A60|nr:NB-ARC domain-containing protein [Amycolatopsis sp. RTGN1]